MTDVSRRDFIAGAALAATASPLATQPANAQTEAVNVEAFISGVRAARVFDLGFIWDGQAPVLSLNPPYAFALNATHRQTHEIFGTAPGSQISWASEILYFSGQHGPRTSTPSATSAGTSSSTAVSTPSLPPRAPTGSGRTSASRPSPPTS